MFECKCFIQDMGNAVLTLSITVLLSASSPQPLKIDTLTFKSYLYYCYYLDLWYIATCTVHVYIAAYKWQWWQWVKLIYTRIHYVNFAFSCNMNMHLIYSTNRKWWNSSCTYSTTSHHLYRSRHLGYHGATAPDCINTSGLYYQKVSLTHEYTWMHVIQ